jgi:hypothetical protein
MTYADSQIPTTLNIAGADGRTVTISSTVGGTRGTLTVAAGVATGSITYGNGVQDITASVSDTAGNACTTTITAVTVNSSDCALSLTNGYSNTNGVWFNRSNTMGITGNSGTAIPVARTTNCTTGRVVTLQRTTPAGTAVTATTNASGDATFSSQTFADGEVWSLSVPNGVRPATTLSFRVDLDAPVFGVAPANLGQVRVNGTLTANGAASFFVAGADNRNIETATAGYFADLGAAAGAQADFVIDAIDAFDFGIPGRVSVTFNGGTTPLATAPVSAAAQTISFTGGSAITLPHNDSGPLAVTVTDAADNTTTWLSAATIDVVAPASPPAFTQTVSNARRAQVTLAWDPSFDDGSTMASGACQYEAGWTTSSVPGNASLGTSTVYFSSVVTREPRVAHSSTRITQVYNLPPLNTYFIKVRAVDEVGNYSAFGTAPTGLPNMWTEVVLTNPSTDSTASSHNFGAWLATGRSLNNDSIGDIAVGAPNRGPTSATNRGSVYIYYGATNFAAPGPMTCTAPSCQELQPPTDATVSGLFGTDISMGGNVGDVAAENKADLLISQPTWQTNVGRAFLYFGANAPQINSGAFVEFRGTAGISFGSAAKIINDIDGDGLDEVVITAHTETVAGRMNQGRIYIYKGRSADPTFMAGTAGANWFNSRTATDGMGVPFVPTSAATWVLDGPNPVVASNNEFGRLRPGLVSLGQLHTGTPVRNSFLVPMSRETVNRVAAYFGPQFPASGTLTYETSGLLQEVRPLLTGSATNQSGFGRSAIGGLNIAGASGLDLAVSYPLRFSVYLYYELGTTGVAGCASGTACNPSLTIVGATGSQFGFHLSAGDLNGDSATDVVSSEGLTTGGRAWVAWQRMGSFDTTIDGVAPSFWVSEFSVPSASQLGRVHAVADIDGANGPELILTDAAAGTVRIWR